MVRREQAVTLRRGRPHDAAAVAAVWYDAWRDAHVGIVPEEIVQVRTRQSFAERAAQHVDELVVAEAGHEVAGFVLVAEAEVEQLFVAAHHRGTAIAPSLLHEAERLVAQAGHPEAWLAVVEGNARARRFYERHGWRDDGVYEHLAPGLVEPVVILSRRYVKQVDSLDP